MKLNDLFQTERKPTRLQRLANWLWRFLPVTRARMEREIAKAKSRCERERADQLEQMRQRHKQDIDDTAKVVDIIIKRCSCINFRHEEGDQYAIMLRFAPRLIMGGMCTRDELRFVAERVARQVEMEIATARFIQKADDLERQKYDRKPDFRPF